MSQTRSGLQQCWDGAGNGDSERRTQSIEEKVRETRIATWDHELGSLQSTGQKHTQQKSAQRTPAYSAQQCAQREEQHHIQKAVGDRSLAAQHAEYRGCLAGRLEGNQGRPENRQQPQEEEPSPHSEYSEYQNRVDCDGSLPILGWVALIGYSVMPSSKPPTRCPCGQVCGWCVSRCGQFQARGHPGGTKLGGAAPAAVVPARRTHQAYGGVMNGADGNQEPEKNPELRCASAFPEYGPPTIEERHPQNGPTS